MAERLPAYFALIPDDDGRPVSTHIELYVAGPARLRAAVEGLDPALLRTRTAPGTWSALEVLGHVADCDQYLADRMKRTIALDRPLLVGADTDRYPDALGYPERDPETQLRLVEATRAQLAPDLARLPDAAWSRTGLHTEVGLFTLRLQLLYAVKHLDDHTHLIELKRAALES